MRMGTPRPRTPLPPPQHLLPSTVTLFPRHRHRHHVTRNLGTSRNGPVSFPRSLPIGALVSLGSWSSSSHPPSCWSLVILTSVPAYFSHDRRMVPSFPPSSLTHASTPRVCSYHPQLNSHLAWVSVDSDGYYWLSSHSSIWSFDHRILPPSYKSPFSRFVFMLFYWLVVDRRALGPAYRNGINLIAPFLLHYVL